MSIDGSWPIAGWLAGATATGLLDNENPQPPDPPEHAEHAKNRMML